MANNIQRKYHLFDAEGRSVGRLSTEIAKVLRGKDKVAFAPYLDGGDFVVVINSDKIKISGNKEKGKIYHRFSGYPGGITSINLQDQMGKDSTKVVEGAVWGMLCKNKLRPKMMRRLLIYKSSEHKHKIDVTH